jgi:hypothetical protein
VAELLRNGLGVEVTDAKGSFRELSVLVDDKIVARRRWFRFPKDDELLSTVKQAMAA